MPVADPPAAPDHEVRTGDDVVYGLLRVGGIVGGIDVALPLAVLREVVPCPEQLAPLPVRAAGLLGAVVVRETVLPVVDLRSLAGVPDGRHEHQVVVVVAYGGRLVGLLADQVRGVSRVAAQARFAMAAHGSALLFSHTFCDGEEGRVVSVLDAATLLALPGVPTVEDVGRAGVELAGLDVTAGAVGGPAYGRSGQVHTVLRCGDRLLALDVRFVHTTLPGAVARPSVVDGELCRGTVPFGGHDVPVVDVLSLLGLGRLPSGPTAEPPGAGLVLDLGAGKVVVELGALLDLQELAPHAVLPMPAFAVARPDLLAGVADVPGHGPCLVLDGEALLRDPVLRGLAAVNTRTDAGDGRRRSVRGAGPDADPDAGPAVAAPGAGTPYLRLLAGTEVCAPLEHVAEIVPVPSGVVAAAGDDAVLGVCAHRGAAVPVVSLARVLGVAEGARTPESCMLLVQAPGGHVGLVVDRLHAIDPLRWSDPSQAFPQAAGAPRPTGPADRSVAADGHDAPTHLLADAPLVQLEEASRLLPALDLRAVAASLGRPPAGEPTDPPQALPSSVPASVPPSVPLPFPPSCSHDVPAVSSPRRSGSTDEVAVP